MNSIVAEKFVLEALIKNIMLETDETYKLGEEVLEVSDQRK